MEKSKTTPYLKYLKYLFCILCIVLALYMIVLEAERFVKNEDTTSIGFKSFDSSPGNMYPALTLCFFSKLGEIFDEEYLLENFGIDGKTYMACSMGSCSNEKEFENITSIDFDEAVIKPVKFIKHISTKMTNGYSWKSRWTRQTPLSYLPIYKTHQSPQDLCYTLMDDLDHGIFKDQDMINLDLEYLKTLAKQTNKTLNLMILTHYHGQFYRDKTHILRLLIKAIDEMENRIIISLSKVDIIRKRPDANIPCDPNHNSDDDYLWRNATLSLLGCLPSFWKTFANEHSMLPACNSSSQLKKFFLQRTHDMIDDLSDLDDNITSLYTPPCDEMSLTASFYDKPNGNSKELAIRVGYPKRTFKEIVNRKAFNFEAFWSGVGGFVGIFLGYSLMQLPEIICGSMAFVFSRHNNS